MVSACRAILVAWVFCAGSVWAQERDGLFVTVPTPITDQAVANIRQKVEDAVLRKKRVLSTVVFDFNPAGQPALTTSFGAPNELADFIRSLRQGYKQFPKMTTIAFIHNEVAGHTALPVLACRQIVFSSATDDRNRPKAKLGDIRKGQDRELTEPTRLAYAQIAQNDGLGDLTERMMNKDLPLKKVKTLEGIRYLSPDSLRKLEKDGKQFQVEGAVAGLETGSAFFDADLAQKVGLAQERYNNRADLARALGLSRTALNEDWLVGRTPIAWRIEVKGPINRGALESLERRIKMAVKRDANMIILQLESDKGETADVASLAQRIHRLTDDQGLLPIKTVAWIPPNYSLGAATYLALGCQDIVMGKNAALADFDYLLTQRDGESIDETRKRLKNETMRRWEMMAPLIIDQGYPALLFEACLTKLPLYRVKTLTGEPRIITEDQLEADKKLGKPQYVNLGRINPNVDAFKITTEIAREWNIASAEIDSVDGMYNHFGLEGSKVKVARDDWLDTIAEFFREPAVNFLLVMIGIVGLILELKMPGATVPGVIAAICFVLFFWAYSFVGEFTILAVLLFLLGLVLVGVEIFVLPGFGFTGISGIVLIVSSLVLVTLEKMPETTQDWVNLGGTLGTFGLSLVSAIVAVVIIAWYLPSIPYASRLVLQPPDEDAEGQEPALGEAPASLLGAIGVASTPLRPAGKAQIGDDFLDVVAEGDYVTPGSRIQVIEIEGNRIVVKEI